MNGATEIALAIGVVWLAVIAGKLGRIALALEKLACDEIVPSAAYRAAEEAEEGA